MCESFVKIWQKELCAWILIYTHERIESKNCVFFVVVCRSSSSPKTITISWKYLLNIFIYSLRNMYKIKTQFVCCLVWKNASPDMSTSATANKIQWADDDDDDYTIYKHSVLIPGHNSTLKHVKHIYTETLLTCSAIPLLPCPLVVPVRSQQWRVALMLERFQQRRFSQWHHIFLRNLKRKSWIRRCTRCAQHPTMQCSYPVQLRLLSGEYRGRGERAGRTWGLKRRCSTLSLGWGKEGFRRSGRIFPFNLVLTFIASCFYGLTNLYKLDYINCNLFTMRVSKNVKPFI